MQRDSETTGLKRHYNPAEIRPHHYGQGATQRIYKFENGHPDVSVIPVRLGDGTVLLDTFEVAMYISPGGKLHVVAYYQTEEEVQRILDAMASSWLPTKELC